MPALLEQTLFCCGTQLIVNVFNSLFKKKSFSIIKLCQLPGKACAFKYRVLHPHFTSPLNVLKHHVKPSLLHFKLVAGS